MKLPVPPRSLMVFLSKLKVFWKEWDVQTMVLTSLAMQLILILVAPFRKRTSNQIVIVSIWLAYLLADWFAAQGIGLIARPCGSMTSAEAGSAELYAFWGQFLLLHLGGPDTITALALEDNELWLRTGLHLGVQAYGSLGVLVKSIAQYGSNLWVPTILMFMAGILKYLERVTSLFHGRLVKFCEKQHLKELDDSDFHSIHEKSDDSNSVHEKSDDSNSDFQSIPVFDRAVKLEQLTNVEMVRSAYCLFKHFRGFNVDREIATRKSSKKSFSMTTSSEAAFKQVEMQLSFAYEAFYTKAVIIHTSWSWKVLRFLVASLLVGCLAVWLFFTNKQGFLHYNVQITYTLLISAIIAELLAFVRIQLSDWTIAQSKEASGIKILFYNIFLSADQKRTWGRYWRKEDAPTSAYLRRFFFRRWSESISQLNMISMCMGKPRPYIVQKAIDFFELNDALDKRRYVCHMWFSNYLRNFIFEDIQQISRINMAIRNIGHTKGGIALKRFIEGVEAHTLTYSEQLRFTSQLFNIHWNYDEILMRWHIITELSYVTHVESQGSNWRNLLKVEGYQEICKTLSDYLFSLLICQPEMMPTVAATKKRSQDMMTMLKAIKEAQLKTINDKLSLPNRAGRKSTIDLRRDFCECIRMQQSAQIMEGREAEFLVNDIMSELEKLEEELGQLAKWKLMAEVWAELLYYAAIRCKPRLHAAKLRQGGELLSVVWMLLHQFGYGLDEAPRSQENLTDPKRGLLYVTL